MCPRWWGKRSLLCGRKTVKSSASRKVEFWLKSTHSSVPAQPGTLPLLPRIRNPPFSFLLGSKKRNFCKLKSSQKKMVRGCISGTWVTKLSRVAIKSSTWESCACRRMDQPRYSNKPYLVALCCNYVSWRLRVLRHDDYRCYRLHGGETSTLKTKQTWWLQ